MSTIPDFKEIIKAHEIIKPYIHCTSVLTSQTLNIKCDAEIFFKCENMQKSGAFKMRGAMNALLSKEFNHAKGVATHSSGNHAGALALACRMLKIPCYVVMPLNAPDIKRNAVADYGARIISCQPAMDDRISTLSKVLAETGACAIPPYNDPHIIAGQGTAAIELLHKVPDLDSIVVPVGGGGLASGTAIAAKNINPAIRVFGAEPELADDARRSLAAGKIIPSNYPNTIADGLRTSLGDLTFKILREYINDIISVSDKETISAMRLVWERMKIIIEPSSAVPVAALLNKKIAAPGNKIGVILSGGNVSLQSLPWL